MKTNKPPALPQVKQLKRDYANRSWLIRKHPHRIPIIIVILALILAMVAQTALAEGNGWVPAKNPDDGFIYICPNGMPFHSPTNTEALPDKNLCAELLIYKNKMLDLKTELNKAANFDRIKTEILTTK